MVRPSSGGILNGKIKKNEIIGPNTRKFKKTSGFFKAHNFCLGMGQSDYSLRAPTKQTPTYVIASYVFSLAFHRRRR